MWVLLLRGAFQGWLESPGIEGIVLFLSRRSGLGVGLV